MKYEPYPGKERPASANKAASGYYQRELCSRLGVRGLRSEYSFKPELLNYKQ
jgi:hypothetical protein